MLGINDSLVVSGNANIDVDDFANSGTISVTNNSLNLTSNTFSNAGGVLNADTFALSVAGNFDYDEGTITANTYNLNVGGAVISKILVTLIVPLLAKSAATILAFPETVRISLAPQSKSFAESS